MAETQAYPWPQPPRRGRVPNRNNYQVMANGCWIWQGALTSRGYGHLTIGGKHVQAHRYQFILHKGDIPKGLQLDHLCRNRACVNPDHLEAVEPRENKIRGLSFSAINARKTECPQGHPYDEANTYVRYHGARQCRTCNIAYRKSLRERKRKQRERRAA